jgi:hypothetical protein
MFHLFEYLRYWIHTNIVHINHSIEFMWFLYEPMKIKIHIKFVWKYEAYVSLWCYGLMKKMDIVGACFYKCITMDWIPKPFNQFNSKSQQGIKNNPCIRDVHSQEKIGWVPWVWPYTQGEIF